MPSHLRAADRRDLRLLTCRLADAVASKGGGTVTLDVLQTGRGLRTELRGFSQAVRPDPATAGLLDERSATWAIDRDVAWFELDTSTGITAGLDENLLFDLADGGDLEARAELVRRYRGFARSMMRRFGSTSLSGEDLEQVALIGLLKAIDRFDPDRKVKFTTFAARTIDGELKRHLRDSGWSIRVPRGLQELGLRAKRAAAELTQREARPPTVEEVAETIDAPPDEVGDALLARQSFGALSLDTPPGDDGLPLLETLVSPDGRLDIAPEWARLSRLLQRLPDRERRILYLRYWEDLSQSQIAERVGISQMHVSRLLRRSIEKLRRMIGAAPEAA
jgi:RNA polymerase sigma-B factor